MAESELNIGVVGAGGFAGFAAKAFLKVSGIKITGIADTNSAAANTMAGELSAKAFPDYESLLRDDSIDLVYIATPPFLHYGQSKMGLLAGKHVICEKPAALRTLEAEELVQLAKSKQLLYIVNLMQRYNPLYEVVQNIIKENVLGEFLHGFFENYASDENLGPDHWFWDRDKSGGIFIEHGVHFFDMFSGWLGKGEVIHAAEWQRQDPAEEITDRVQATVRYQYGPVTFYHGFDQPKLLDRQEMRLQFEQGDITLYEWVPVKLRLHGLVETKKLEKLKASIRNASIVVHHPLHDRQKTRGRFKDIFYDQHVTLEYGNITDKQLRYQELLVAMITDQWNWIRDRNVVRKINENNAVESLRMAEQATLTAQHFSK